MCSYSDFSSTFLLGTRLVEGGGSAARPRSFGLAPGTVRLFAFGNPPPCSASWRWVVCSNAPSLHLAGAEGADSSEATGSSAALGDEGGGKAGVEGIGRGPLRLSAGGGVGVTPLSVRTRRLE